MKTLITVDTAYGSIQYECREDCMVLASYRGTDRELLLPEEIDGKPLVEIGKKAFLSCKQLQHIVLPSGIMRIQDWAFAGCAGLEILRIPYREIFIGQGILKDCQRLIRIIPEGKTEICQPKEPHVHESIPLHEDIPYLLAAVMNKLAAFYLFDMTAAGSENWLAQWDKRMLALLKRDDEEGFSKMLLCGEEDYGSRENNLDYYIEQRKKEKVRLCMLRLMHDIGLRQQDRKYLQDYLKSHTKGEQSEETWRVVLEEHGDEKLFYQLLLDQECIHTRNFSAILEDMGREHTEMKAFLMERWEKRRQKDAVFETLAFDL